MKKIAKCVLFLAVVGLVYAPALQAQGKSGKAKVELIHKGHVISVAPEAVPAHLAHGDQLVTPPPPTMFTVTVTKYEPQFNNTVTYTESVAAGGSVTFSNFFGLFSVLVEETAGDADFTRIGGDLVVSNVQSDATAYYEVGPGLPGGGF